MCKQVWTDEWSGMLFYETEGEFGKEGFKVIAKELFPLDIGSATYTEYQTDDPELIKFMMANKPVLHMKKGHIHSHNNMPVFFSGTDNDELGENCGFHNFYLSLIVNNKNDMCAKIAFKAKVKTVANHTYIYKNQEGKDVSMESLSEKETEHIFVYKCDILLPQGGEVEDTFKSRFQELNTKKENAKKASEAAKQSVQGGIYGGYYGGKEAWEQAGLFDNVPPQTKYAKGEKGAKKDSSMETLGTRGMDRNVKVTDKRVYSMLAKILYQDYIYEGTISKALERMDSLYYDKEGVISSEALSYAMYLDAIEQKALDFYIDSFPEDRHLLGFEGTMERCVEILETYDQEYPELITHLSEALTLEIK